MATVPGIMVDIGANVARMQQDMRRLTGTMESGFGQMRSIALRFAGVIAGAFSFRELIRFGDEALKTGDRLAKLSQSAGVSVETLSSLKYAAELADVDLQTLGKSLGILSRNMLDAQAGTGEAKDAIKALGISIQDTGGNLLASDKVMGQIADKFASMRDGSSKTALAMRVFGRSGAELIPLLNQGSAALEEMRTEAEKMGLVFSTDTAQQMERINDNFTRMRSAIQGVAIRIVSNLAPTLENLTNIFVELSKETGNFKDISESLALILKTMATAALGTYLGFQMVGRGLAQWAAKFGQSEESIKAINEAFNEDMEEISRLLRLYDQIWGKGAEDAVKNKAKMNKALSEGPTLAGEGDKQSESIQKIIDKLFEQAEAIQMGEDALKLYQAGLHNATAEQRNYALYLMDIISEHDRAKREIENYLKSLEEEERQVLENETAIYDLVDAYKMQAVTAGMTEEEIAKLQLRLKGVSEELIGNVEAYFKAIRAAERYREEIDLLKGVIEETKTPMDRYEERMREIQGLLDKGMIGPETALRAQQIAWGRMIGGEKDAAMERERILLNFADRIREQNRFSADYAIVQIERQAAVFKKAGADEVAVAIWEAKEKQKASRAWQDGAVRGLQDYAAAATNAAKNTEDFFTNAFRGMEDALVDFVATGKASFSDLVNSILRDLLRLMIRQNITGPLAASLSGVFAGGAGYGGAGAYTTEYNWHKGGIVGEFAQSNRVPASYFAYAPRLHRGLQPEEFPAILRRGEGVFTPEQMKALGNQTNISISIPVSAGGTDPRKAGLMRRDMESELEPMVRKIVERYV